MPAFPFKCENYALGKIGQTNSYSNHDKHWNEAPYDIAQGQCGKILEHRHFWPSAPKLFLSLFIYYQIHVQH